MFLRRGGNPTTRAGSDRCTSPRIRRLENFLKLIGAETLFRFPDALPLKLLHPGFPDGLSSVGPNVRVHTNGSSTVGDPANPTAADPLPGSIQNLRHGRGRGRRGNLRGLRDSLVDRRGHGVRFDTLLLVSRFEWEPWDWAQCGFHLFDTVDRGILRIDINGVGVYGNVLELTHQVITCPFSARLLKVS
jgi:hypothetical protein